MLQIPQLKNVEQSDPYLYEALKRIVGAINSLGARLKVDPLPSAQTPPGQTMSPPPAPAAVAVTPSQGAFGVLVSAPPAVDGPAEYFLEASANPSFGNPTVYPLGSALAASIPLGNVLRYWRVRAKYPESGYSPYTYLGTAANPAGLYGGLVNNPNSAVGATVQPGTSSATYVTLPEMSLGLTTRGNRVLVLFSGSFQRAAAGKIFIAAYRDSAAVSQVVQKFFQAGETAGMSLSFLDNPAAGAHTYEIRWRVDAGSGTALGTDRQVQVVEFG
jgi:hypothetical protein